MRIFKNRGDIFFSKTNKEKSTEQKILLIFLAAIVIFTAVFMFIVAAKNDFSVKKFFEPENLTAVEEVTETTSQLPEVSGKTNFLVTVSEDSKLLFAELLQVDMDNKSYKICALRGSTVYDGSSLEDIYSESGAQNVQTAVESLFSADIDYYIDFERSEFVQYFDSLGSVNYAFSNEIKYKDSDSDVPYNLRIKSGEQSIKGAQAVNLVRYYLSAGKNQSAANEILLTALSQQMNSENYENREELFQTLVTNSNTNITVRDFSSASDNITVLCNSQNGMGIYSAEIKYKNNKITEKSLQSAKGYFKK